jgi:flagellar biosynthesis GTPase FlhF
MKAFVREAQSEPDGELLEVALEARLAHIEELVRELHEWMRSEQVATFPESYRRLYTHLLANDFERRHAGGIIRTLYHRIGPREVTVDEVQAAATLEIDNTVKRIPEALPQIRSLTDGQRPYVTALVGPSGAGKTTMMYKLAVRAVLNEALRVKIVSTDTYKIGSVEGVRTIADILSVPYGIAFEPSELPAHISASDADLVILDTAGRADRQAREELGRFLEVAHPDETHLVLSATMSQRALQETAAQFLDEQISCVTFTKLDEAPSLGAMLSAAHWLGMPIGYLSNGTRIPDDLIAAEEAPFGDWTINGAPLPDHDLEAQHV